MTDPETGVKIVKKASPFLNDSPSGLASAVDPSELPPVISPKDSMASPSNLKIPKARKKKSRANSQPMTLDEAIKLQEEEIRRQAIKKSRMRMSDERKEYLGSVWSRTGSLVLAKLEREEQERKATDQVKKRNLHSNFFDLNPVYT